MALFVVLVASSLPVLAELQVFIYGGIPTFGLPTAAVRDRVLKGQ